MKSCTYLFTRGWVVGSAWKGSLVLSALCSFFIRHVVGCVAVPSSSCPVLAEFPFYFQVTSACLNIPAALYTPSQPFTLLLLALLPAFSYCSRALSNFTSPVLQRGFAWRFHQLPFRCGGFWELSERVPSCSPAVPAEVIANVLLLLCGNTLLQPITRPCRTPASGPHPV